MQDDDLKLTDKEVEDLMLWRQGDYALAPKEFVSVLGADSEGNLEFGADPNIQGVVVVSQTCDVVRCTPGKDHVIVAPFVELPETMIPAAQSGATPAYYALPNAPAAQIVVDLSRMMSVHKKALVGWQRSAGFNDDSQAARFAGALERKYGRFAFPDRFADEVIAPLRDKFKKPHRKQNDNGRIVRSIHQVRVQAAPAWEAPEDKIGFRFVLEDKPEASYLEVSKFIGDVLKTVTLPTGFSFEEPKFTLRDLDGYSAREWTNSQRIDWDYISGR
ncbi:hypothetical protein [Asticcacaulis sp. 201]|uniref:hypothetical protein n=1 Tax=Asticcacaulis sp. 201 TaxID=3028787 RepID=UPI002916D54A|nr:hypothetical protein [Asticcacaulis sp. 201]MDV6333075.1 hypothetical protein [Asticcacaulis sp. 201]